MIIFCYSVNTQYNPSDNQKINLKTKSEAIAGNLINLQGLTKSLSIDWEYQTDPVNGLNYLGFATNPTVGYGVIYKSNSEIVDGPYPKNYVGQTRTCFLAGTKIVMADGTYKNIETIVVGDTVKSFDEKNRQTEDKKVTKIFHHASGEMGDYYLVINKYLRVTPNHQFYTEKGWVTADSLKIGDKLSYSSECNKIYSIEKIYEKVETYNFEIEENHNYFVTFDSDNILVHNAGVEANFTWFDEDGLAPLGITVYFKSTSEGDINYYIWQRSTDGVTYDPPFKEGPELTAKTAELAILERCYIKLTVSGPGGSDSIIKIVEANKLSAEPDPEPWILTGKNVNPDVYSTLSSYEEGYYILYSETVPSSIYKVYEVKEKKSSDMGIPILSDRKIDIINGLDSFGKAKIYDDMKNWLGLNSSSFYYNFHIKIYSYISGVLTRNLDFGASDEGVNDKVSVTKQVLIYTPPVGNVLGEISSHPRYNEGVFILSTFLGGTPPTI